MKFNTFIRVIKLGFTNFWRNLWLSLVATLIMTITLLIISVFVIFNIVINTTTESIKEKIDLAVYFKNDINEQDVRIIEQTIKSRADVKSVYFVSKEEALSRWNEMKISQKVKDQISNENNPLPYSLDIKTYDTKNLEQVANYLSSADFAQYVDRVSYKDNKEIIDRLVNITSFSSKLGLILAVVFTVISILVVTNTVRLAVFTRSKEVEIMRLVGANDVFVRTPFVVEALIYSFLATVLSIGMIWIGLALISPMITRYLGDININLSGFFISNLGWIFFFELLFSSILTISSTFISLRRNLKI